MLQMGKLLTPPSLNASSGPCLFVLLLKLVEDCLEKVYDSRLSLGLTLLLLLHVFFEFENVSTLLKLAHVTLNSRLFIVWNN